MSIITIHYLVPKNKTIHVEKNRLDTAINVACRIMHEYERRRSNKNYKEFISNLNNKDSSKFYPLYSKEEIINFDFDKSFETIKIPKIEQWDKRFKEYIRHTDGEEKYFIYPLPHYFKKNINYWTKPHLSVALLGDDSLTEDINSLHEYIISNEDIKLHCDYSSLDISDWLKSLVCNVIDNRKNINKNQIIPFRELPNIPCEISCPCKQHNINLGNLEFNSIEFTNLYIEIPDFFTTDLSDHFDWGILYSIFEEILGVKLIKKMRFLV